MSKPVAAGVRAGPDVDRGPWAALRRFARPRVKAEKCDLCGARLAAEHPHLVAMHTRRLLCCCEACAVLFSGQQSAAYRRVPQRVEYLPDFRVTDVQWESLLIPINLAFFFYSTPAARELAVYPSPAGPTESLLGLEAWHTLVDENPVLRELEPDVEALLVNRMWHAHDCFRVPIDECYRLVGLIRLHWRGLSGGSEVWAAVGQFFTHLKERSCST